MFNNENDLKKQISRLNIDTEPNDRHRVNLRRKMLSVFNKNQQKNRWQTIGRTIMKTKITKLATAAVIIIAVVLSISVFEKSIPSAYAIEKTVEALRNIRFIHLVHRDLSGSIADERWIELGPDLRQLRYRQNTPPDFLDIEDGNTVAMYRKDKNTVVLYDPKDKCFTIGPIGKFLKVLAEQKLIIDENVEYRGRSVHRVRCLMANQDVFVDPDTFLPIAGAGLEFSYENLPEETFEIVIPDNFSVIDKRPNAEPVDEPEWFLEYEAADENFTKGKKALAKNDLENAASLFEHVVKHQPHRNWAWYWLGRVHYELGEYDLAIYEFTKTLEIVGSFSYCHYSRALAYLQKGMKQAGKEDLEKALPWMILALRYPEATTMFEIADRPFGGKPFQTEGKQHTTRMIKRLRTATGQKFGYELDADLDENEQAIAAWEQWYKNSGEIKFTPDAELVTIPEEREQTEQ